MALDYERDAAIHLLCSPLLSGKTQAFIEDAFGDIDWDGLDQAARVWSSSERLTYKAARGLWTGEDGADIAALCRTLDDGNLKIVIEAMQIRRGWSPAVAPRPPV